MNLKILAFPLLILAIIILSIWFIYPAYSELNVARAQLDEINKNMENISQKIQTAEKLNMEIMNNEKYREILTNILPSEKNEENIVNELNNVTFTLGMLIYGLSFDSNTSSAVHDLVPALDEFGNPLLDPNTGQPVFSETIPKIKFTQAKLGSIGDYTKARGFLRKMVGLKRSNSIAAVKIFKDTSSAQESGSASNGILKIEADIDFRYLGKVKNTIDIDDGIFTSGQLNLSALDEIQKIKDTAIPELRTDSQGKTNPFVL